jgi:GNAT superfamily N-acetyltransferase
LALSPYKIAALAPDRSGYYRHLTFPRLGSRLEDLGSPWLLVSASRGDEPVGLAVAHHAEVSAEIMLQSIFVAPSYRRRGIARALLQAVEDRARERKVVRLHSRFLPTMKMADAFVQLIGGAQWSRPKIVSLNLAGEAGPMARIGSEWPGVKTWLDNPGTFSFGTWRPLVGPDQDALGRLRAQAAYRYYLDFDAFESTIDPVCSLQIRRAGELVGWIAATPYQGPIVKRHGDRVGRWYRSAYIDETLWRSAGLIAGYCHAFSRQGAAYGNDSIATYFTDFPSQMALTRRRFKPIALSVEEIHEVSKLI